MFWNKHQNNDDRADEPVTDTDNEHEEGGNDHQSQTPCKVEPCSVCPETATLLESAFNELEKERAKRKELEVEVALLKKQLKQQATSSQKKSRPPSSVPSKELAMLQAEAEGYQQIVNALTMGRPAIDAAVAALRSHTTSSSSSEITTTNANHAASNSLLVNPYKPLPLNSVQFLEVMPWHPKALEAAMVTEELYEWQVYSAEKKAWRSELAFFPTFFKALPVITPGEACRDAKYTKPGVWTNQTVNLRFDLRDGCVLPFKSGAPSWKWIGGWEVDSNSSILTSKEDYKDTTITTTISYSDNEGWSYAKEAGHFPLAETCSSPSRLLIAPSSLPQELSSNARGAPSIIRRRKWSRQRVLVDYPYACENTVRFLELLAEGESLKVSNSLLESARHEAEQALVDAEARIAQARQQWEEERGTLEGRLVSLEEEHKVQLEALERRRGPSIEHFPLPKVIFKRPDDSDTDSDDDDDDEHNWTTHSATREAILNASALLLHPEDGIIGRSARGNGKHSNRKRRSFFAWGKDDRDAPSPTPDTMELCSDEYSVTSGDRDTSEQTTTDDEASMHSVALFSSPQPTVEERKSFLEMFFGNKHHGEGGTDAPAVLNHEGAQAA